MQRRTFLRAAGAASAAVVVGRWFRGTSWAEPFGEAPSSAASVMLPPARQAKRVLEIFLYGGLSQWETLYLVRNYGRPTDPMFPNQQYYTFDFDTTGGTRRALTAANAIHCWGSGTVGQLGDGNMAKLTPTAVVRGL